MDVSERNLININIKIFFGMLIIYKQIIFKYLLIFFYNV